MHLQVSSSKERPGDINVGVIRITKWYDRPRRAQE